MLLLNKYPEYYDLLTRYEAMAVRVGDEGLLGALYARLGRVSMGSATAIRPSKPWPKRRISVKLREMLKILGLHMTAENGVI